LRDVQWAYLTTHLHDVAFSHVVISQCGQPVIGYGDAVGVVAEITECMVRASGWRLGINDPVVAE
jgi:hypothetical protein